MKVEPTGTPDASFWVGTVKLADHRVGMGQPYHAHFHEVKRGFMFDGSTRPGFQHTTEMINVRVEASLAKVNEWVVCYEEMSLK